MKKFILLAVAAGLLSAGGMRPSFSSIDSNKDGKISKSEFNHIKSMRNSMMGKMASMMGKMPKKIPSFSAIDKNRDGFISKAEFNSFKKMMH